MATPRGYRLCSRDGRVRDVVEGGRRRHRLLWSGPRAIPGRAGIEVSRSTARTASRGTQGKADPADAVEAARAVLSGRCTGTPKSRDGNVEAIRALLVAEPRPETGGCEPQADAPTELHRARPAPMPAERPVDHRAYRRDGRMRPRATGDAVLLHGSDPWHGGPAPGNRCGMRPRSFLCARQVDWLRVAGSDRDPRSIRVVSDSNQFGGESVTFGLIRLGKRSVTHPGPGVTGEALTSGS